MSRLLTLICLLTVACSAAQGGRSALPGVRPSAEPVGELQRTLRPLTPQWEPEIRNESRPLARDIVSLRGVGQARLAPDGSRLVYTLRVPSFDADAEPENDDDLSGGWSVRYDLAIVDADGGGEDPRQLASGEESMGSVEWSPQGEAIAFVRKRGESSTIHILPMAGGEARPLELGELEPMSLRWAPDGKAIAFTATPPLTKAERQARFRKGGARVYEGDFRQIQLFVVGVDGGEPRRVDRGSESVLEFEWSPNGEQFAIITSRSADPYERFLLKRVAIISSETGDVVIEPEPGPINLRNLAWSPDGHFIAFMVARVGLTMMHELSVCAVESGECVNAAERLDPTLMDFIWAEDSESLVAHAYEGTHSKLYRLARDGSAAEDVGFSGRLIVGGLSPNQGRSVVATLTSTPTEPASPTLIELHDGSTRVVANPNEQVSSWSFGETEIVHWRNEEGIELEGVLHRTPHAEEGRPAPLMVLPHGGPDWVSLYGFSRWAAYFAARGYSVFRPNYRGGLGYGVEFYSANRGRLGEIEEMDIESGVDHLIETGIADPERLVFGGWSWGGYISAWTLGRTERYRAIVVGAGVVDVATQYASSDVNHEIAADWEFRGRPVTHPESFARSNPARHLVNAVTPTLIIHGEADQRVDFINAEILYRSLVDVGCEVRFLVYPGEPHGFRQPAHSVDMLIEWASWFDGHVDGDE